MKKKIFKIVFIVIFIILMVFLINLLRKSMIINEYSRKLNEYQALKNFYAKFESENYIQEFWRKDDVGITKYTNDDEIRTMYATDNEVWTILDRERYVQKMESHNKGAFLPTIEGATIYVDNFWEAIKLAFESKITSEIVSDKDCYKIYFDKDFQIFVNKKDYMKIKEINSGKTRCLLEYSIGTVKDEDVKFPNIEGYKIEEISS